MENMRQNICSILIFLSLLAIAPAAEEREDRPFTTRLPTTRLYVTEPWELEFEQFYDGIVPRKGKPTQLFQTEVEFGMPGRIQIGINEGLVYAPGDRLRHQEVVFEARYALAQWGKIPLNPAIFAEWHLREHDPDAYELKLLLAENLGNKWLLAFNATFEHEVGGDLESEFGFSQAVLYALIPSKLYVGVEMTLNRPLERGGHGKPEVEYAIGPSIAWKPCKHAEVKIAPLFGVTSHSPRLEIAVLLGIEF